VSPNTDVHHGGTVTISVSGDNCSTSGYTIFIKGKSVGSIDTSTGGGSAVFVLHCRVSPGTQTVVATAANASSLSAPLQIARGGCLSGGPPQSAGATDPTADLAVDPSAAVAVDPSRDVTVDPSAAVAVDPSGDVVVDPTADLTVGLAPDPSATTTDLAGETSAPAPGTATSTGTTPAG
jgi:hypothetical protein